jgi:hypothetical protein
MKNKLITISAISVLAIGFGGCSASFSTNKSTSTTPANTTANAAKPATNTTGNTAAAPKADKPKSVVQNEKKPEGSAKTAKKEVPVPADWVYVYDESKGYGFSVPAGTTQETDNRDGVDFSAFTTPSGIDIFALAYKDKTLTKEDLLKDAVEFLQGMGQKVTPGTLKGESDDYAVADATTVLADGSKGKLRIMVGTDVSDNYVLILGTDPDKFAPNEKIIDEIWGSFEMWSGGSSGN